MLPEIAENETCVCFNNTPAIYRDGLLQRRVTYGLGLHSYGAFLNAARSLNVGLRPLGADGGAVRGISPLRCPWSPRECLQDQLEALK